MPHRRLAGLLHDARALTAEQLEDFTARLERIADGNEDELGRDPDAEPLTLSQVVSLGFLSFVKAQRESSLTIEIAIREELDEIVKLAASVSAGIARIESRVGKVDRELDDHRETMEGHLHAVAAEHAQREGVVGE